jgi:Tol biopolymer transport system component
VYLVRPDGRGERLLARDAAGPSWSPDGRLIAFLAGVSSGREPWTVSVVRPDGTAKRSLARVRRPAAGDWLGPQSWSPGAQAK